MITQEKMFEDLGSEPDADRGVPLRQPIVEETPQLEAVEPEQTQEETAEGQTEDQQEAAVEVEETSDEIQAEGQAEKMRAKDFAESAGWTLEEFYRDVLVPGEEGDITISEALDNYKSLQAENETLRTERQQLEAKATQQAPIQQYAPEAVDLWNKANYLQQSYEATDWSQVDAAQRVDLKLQYRDEIEKLRNAAQSKQAEHQVKVDEDLRKFQVEVNAQMIKEIPDWRVERVRAQETEGLKSYLMSEGAQGQTVDMILQGNPWATKMLRRLWQYEKERAATQKAVKKVQKVPRSLRPGAGGQPVKKPSLAEVGKFVNEAKSRRIRDQRLLEADFDDSLLPK